MDIKKSILPVKQLGIAVLNSYGMLFFSKNKLFAALVLMVSFFTPATGLCGLIALTIALITANALGFAKEQISQGLLTYSVILFGFALGATFEYSIPFWILLFVGSLLTLFLSITLNAILNKKGLPALSLAFIIGTWVVMIASKSFQGIGLTQRHIYWFNELYQIGGNPLVNFIAAIENWTLSDYMAGFFRSMSAIIFQSNIASGVVLSIGLLIYSRIAFSLAVIGYALAIVFNYVMGGFNHTDLTYYNMGTNYMLVAIALGGFYLIPSIKSYGWTIITVPISFLLVVTMGSVSYKTGAPFYSLPFCIMVIVFMYVLQLRGKTTSLILTPIQFYSPEQNLYRYLSGKERIKTKYYHSLHLPFMGEWMVSQGYNGDMTHKGDWGKALDFVILDDEMKTYQNPGSRLEHFYCFGKPICSPADGIIEEVIDHIEDNEIGQNNTLQNWGNTIVIKHAEGLYTKLSHLKKHSIKVAKGTFVKRGQIIAACGNSGRSPEPHLHMQVQSTPYVGSKTIAYPIAYFKSRKNKAFQLENFATPAEGMFVSNIQANTSLFKAFNFQPGQIIQAGAEGFKEEEWETNTNYFNESFLYEKENEAYAYFINNGSAFYFTNYIGPKNTLLYQFYLSAYTVLLSSEKSLAINDHYPINTFGMYGIQWLQDLVAPFFIFIKMKYSAVLHENNNSTAGDSIQITSMQTQQFLVWEKIKTNATIDIKNEKIDSIEIESNQKNIQIKCTLKA